MAVGIGEPLCLPALIALTWKSVSQMNAIHAHRFGQRLSLFEKKP